MSSHGKYGFSVRKTNSQIHDQTSTLSSSSLLDTHHSSPLIIFAGTLIPVGLKRAASPRDGKLAEIDFWTDNRRSPVASLQRLLSLYCGKRKCHLSPYIFFFPFCYSFFSFLRLKECRKSNAECFRIGFRYSLAYKGCN